MVAFGLEHTEIRRDGIHWFLTTTFEADSAPSRTWEVDCSRRSSFHLHLAVFTTQERKQDLVRHHCDEAVSVLQSSVIWLFWGDGWRMDWQTTRPVAIVPPCCRTLGCGASRHRLSSWIGPMGRVRQASAEQRQAHLRLERQRCGREGLPLLELLRARGQDPRRCGANGSRP